MRPTPLLAVFALAASVPLHALDVSGYVLTKVGDPIPGAKVCVKSDPGSCATTGADGDFHLVKAIAVRPVREGLAGYSLAYRKGNLIVRSPSAVAARLEWLATDGRRALAASAIRLAAGDNAVALPAGLPHAGVCILRLSTPDHVLAWKAVMAPGSSAAGQAAASTAPRIAALSKAAGGATLEISKSGYRTRNYDPISDPETDAYIFLSETGDVGVDFGGAISQKVVAIDRAKKALITESTDASCDSEGGSVVVHETVRDTQSYAVRDGKLYVWTQGECTGGMFTGSSSDIAGTWTMSDPNALLPEDLRAGCVPDSSIGDETPFENFSAVYTITETQLSGTVSAEMCPGDFLGALFSFLLMQDTSVTTAKNTCKQIQFKNGKGETATFDFSKKGDSLHTAYTYKTSSCAMDMDFSLSDKDPVCPEGDGDLAPFVECLSGSGFASFDPLAKAAAKSSASAPARLPMSRERFAPPARASIAKSPWRAPLRDLGRDGEYISRIWKAAPPRK